MPCSLFCRQLTFSVSAPVLKESVDAGFRERMLTSPFLSLGLLCLGFCSPITGATSIIGPAFPSRVLRRNRQLSCAGGIWPGCHAVAMVEETLGDILILQGNEIEESLGCLDANQ